ncbi:hypothetical protein Dimus_015195 [Dionaea muscipula]
MSMELLTSNHCLRNPGSPFFNSHSAISAATSNPSFVVGDGAANVVCSRSKTRFHATTIKAFVVRNSRRKKLRGRKEEQKNVTLNTEDTSSVCDYIGPESGSGYNVDNGGDDVKDLVVIPSRSSVLQACVVTSGLIGASGFAIRQVSHAASFGGLPILDCTALVSFNLETWHLGLIAELVLLVSSFRYLLLKAWPDFAESSESANRQVAGRSTVNPVICTKIACQTGSENVVLTSLEPFDYLIVAFLPGIGEELLFRGALLPVFGFDWKSVFAVGAIFGVLHLGSGRKYPFAIWATFVGLAYGYATIVSSSVVVPMASHALNNLIGALVWRRSSQSSHM